MARMKISTGPRYEKTDCPPRKQQRCVREVADAIFAQLLPSSRSETKVKRTIRETDGVTGPAHQL